MSSCGFGIGVHNEVKMCMSVKRGHQSEIFSYYRNITPCHVQTKKRMELLYQTAPGKGIHKITWEWFIVENDSLLYTEFIEEEKANLKYLNTKRFT